MTAISMHMLTFGTEQVPKSLSVLGSGDHTITTPIYGALVETTDGLVLLDTGISRAALLDPRALTAIYGADRHPWGPQASSAQDPVADGEPLEIALAMIGLGVKDISLAAVSHLHLDHTGGLPLLAQAGVPIAIQRTELDYGRHRADQDDELDVAFYRADYTRPDLDWLQLDGACELAPGVSVVPTPGHTPGHQSYQVDLPGTGTWILAADAADLGENLMEAIPCGSVSEDADRPAAAVSTRRLIALASATDARLMPGHDPIVWKAAWHPPGGHR